jgi:hypothetical protein
MTTPRPRLVTGLQLATSLRFGYSHTYTLSGFLMLRDSALKTAVHALRDGITTIRQYDYLATLAALSGLIRGWVFQDFKIVFVGAVVHVHFGFDLVSALPAILPRTGMTFVEMVTTERVPIVIPGTAVAVVREHHVLVLIVADPLTAALGLDELPGGPAETAPSRCWTFFLSAHRLLFRSRRHWSPSRQCLCWSILPKS